MPFIDLSNILHGIRGHLIHVVRKQPDELISSLENNGFKVLVINGSRIKDEASFFDEAARAFEFPSYFGKNWAAFNDCLLDFGQNLISDNVAIVWEDVDMVLSTDLQTFSEAVCLLYDHAFGISVEWAQQGRQIEVFLVTGGDHSPDGIIEQSGDNS